MKQSVKLLLLLVLLYAHCDKAQDEVADDPENDAESLANIPDEHYPNGTDQLDTRRAGRIAGGVEVSIANYPFVATLILDVPGNGFSYLTGVIISNSHVLGLPLFAPPGTVISVRVGSNFEDRGGSVMKTVDYKVHPQFDMMTSANSVAIITIDGTFSGLANVRPIAVQTSEIPFSPTSPTNCVMLGWGMNDQYQILDNLNRADYTLAADGTCSWPYGSIVPSMHCAKSVSGMLCQDESRFPLVCNNKLYGLALWSDCKPGTHVFVKIPAASIQQFLAPYLPAKKIFNCPCNSC